LPQELLESVELGVIDLLPILVADGLEPHRRPQALSG
jgi:hypothetical protein